MKVNNKYSIVSDTLNYKVLENKPVQDVESKNYGEDNWVTIAYVSDIKHGLRYLVDKEVMDTSLVDLETIVKAIEDLKNDINNMNIGQV